ncbi:hypothetical protein RQP46_002686 [Phenoliferia psychrophenolica]
MSGALCTPEAKALLRSLDILDQFDDAPLNTLTSPFDDIITLSLYPSPWEDIRRAIRSLLAPDGRKAFDLEKVRGGRLGIRLVWLALEKAADVNDTWERTEVQLWCSRLNASVEEKM